MPFCLVTDDIVYVIISETMINLILYYYFSKHQFISATERKPVASIASSQETVRDSVISNGSSSSSTGSYDDDGLVSVLLSILLSELLSVYYCFT